MTTTTFKPDSAQQFVNWNDPARWSGGVVPNDPAVDVVIPTTTVIATGDPYISVITESGMFPVGSLTISNNVLRVGGTLTVTHNLDISTGGEIDMTGGSLSADSFDNAGIDIQGQGSVTSTGLFLNESSIVGLGLSLTAGSLTNTGSLIASSGNFTVTVNAGGFTNLSGSTLSGGSYRAGFSGNTTTISLFLNVGGVIAIDAANISLDSGGAIYSFDDVSHSYVSIASSLHSIAASGTLSLAHQTFTWSNLTVDGSVTLFNPTLNATDLTVDAGGHITGTGVLGGPILNNGTIIAEQLEGFQTNEGLLLAGPVSGSGTIEIAPAVVTILAGHSTYHSAPLEIAAAASSNVIFDDGHGTVTFDDVAEFAGKIKPAAAGDQIVLRGTSFDSVTGYSYSGDSHGGTLAIQTTGGEIDLQFLGNFTAANFSLAAGPQHLSSDPASLLITNTGSAPTVLAADFNGDTFSDILFRNNATGDTGYTDVHNNVFHSLGGSPAAWSVVGSGDYNGDNFNDILFRNNSTGDTGYTDIHDNVFHSLGGSPAAWSVVGSGDYNGDNFSDILFRNNSTGDTGYTDIHNNVFHSLGGSPAAWSVVGSGDYNGDNFSDILFRNNSTGDTGYTDIHNNVFHSLGGSPASWSVVGSGDYNGDNFSDVLFRNNSTGDTGYTDIHNNVFHSLGGSPAAWSVVGSGDYNGDSFSDILFRNNSTGDTGYTDVHNNVFHSLGGSPADYLVVA
jgi:hypothetical protein